MIGLPRLRVCTVLLLLSAVVIFLDEVHALWTKFDLVQTKKGAWGSTWNTPYIKIDGNGTNGNLRFNQSSLFGTSVANIGDLDGDGVDDLAVGAVGENSSNTTVSISLYTGREGALYILFMTDEGNVRDYTRIASDYNGGPALSAGDNFGTSVCSVGDLNGDGVTDLAVGAPGVAIGAVHVLFMNRNGSAKSSVMIRGRFLGKLDSTDTSSSLTAGGVGGDSYNGPPLKFQSRFGSSLAALGDFDNDGVPDLAVGALGASDGVDCVYVMMLFRNATVKSWVKIASGVNGGPDITLIDPSRVDGVFSGFGSSLQVLQDIDGNGVAELAVGAMYLGDTPNSAYYSGTIFILFLNADGTVKSYSTIGQRTELNKYKMEALPLTENDFCGSALTSVGDINLDNMRQRHPDITKVPARPSIEDLVMGCAQSAIKGAYGRIFLALLTTGGQERAYVAIPGGGDSTKLLSPSLNSGDRFGTSLAGYTDVDNNGIREIVVGAPGTNENSGAIYILFLRRKRYRKPSFNLQQFMDTVGYPLIAVFLASMLLIFVLLYFFRRTLNSVEKAAKKAGLSLDYRNYSVSKKRREQQRSRVYAATDEEMGQGPLGDDDPSSGSNNHNHTSNRTLVQQLQLHNNPNPTARVAVASLSSIGGTTGDLTPNKTLGSSEHEMVAGEDEDFVDDKEGYYGQGDAPLPTLLQGGGEEKAASTGSELMMLGAVLGLVGVGGAVTAAKSQSKSRPLSARLDFLGANNNSSSKRSGDQGGGQRTSSSLQRPGTATGSSSVKSSTIIGGAMSSLLRPASVKRPLTAAAAAASGDDSQKTVMRPGTANGSSQVAERPSTAQSAKSSITGTRSTIRPATAKSQRTSQSRDRVRPTTTGGGSQKSQSRDSVPASASVRGGRSISANNSRESAARSSVNANKSRESPSRSRSRSPDSSVRRSSSKRPDTGSAGVGAVGSSKASTRHAQHWED